MAQQNVIPYKINCKIMPKQIGNTELFSAHEVAQVIGKGITSTLALIRANKIEAEKFGNKYLVSRAQLEKYLTKIKLPPNSIDTRLGFVHPRTGKPLPQNEKQEA